MLLKVIETTEGLVAREVQQSFDGADGSDSERLRPLLVGLCGGADALPGALAAATVQELMKRLQRVAVIPPGEEFTQEYGEGCTGLIVTDPLFVRGSLIWLDVERRRLAVHTDPAHPGVLLYDARSNRLVEYPDARLTRSQKRFEPRSAPIRHSPGVGCWRLDADGFVFLTAWSAPTATVTLGLEGERLELEATADGAWRPVRAPTLELPGLGWPPGLALWTRAWVRWDDVRLPVNVGSTGLDAASVLLPDPVPEEVTWEVEVQLSLSEGRRVVQTASHAKTWPVATAFTRVEVEVDGAATDLVFPDGVVGDLLLTGPGPHPKTLSLRAACPGPTGAGPVHDLLAELRPGTDPARADYLCAELQPLLRPGGAPAEIRLASLGQGELGSLAVQPADTRGHWHPTGPKALGWVATGTKLPARLDRPAVDGTGRTGWAPLEQAIAGPGIARSSHVLRVGGRRRTCRLRLSWSSAPRLRRPEPWRPIRSSGDDDTVEVEFLAEGYDGSDLRIWVPTLQPVEVPSEEARSGRLRVKIPWGIVGSLGRNCARLEVLGGRGEPLWGWLHQNVPVGPGPWSLLARDGDTTLLPDSGRLFVELNGLCSEAHMRRAEGPRGEPAAVLQLDSPWPVDGLRPLGIDGAMLAPVQAAAAGVADGLQSHLWLQDAVREPFHRVLEQRGSYWALAEREGVESEHLGALGRDGDTLVWMPQTPIGFEHEGTFLVWRNRLLQVWPPERPRVRFAGWIWPEDEVLQEEAGPVGVYGLRLDRGAVTGRTWTGTDHRGFSWHEQPPAEVLAHPAMQKAARNGANPTKALSFGVEIDGERTSFTLTAEGSGNVFGKKRLTLSEGSTRRGGEAGPLRVWAAGPAGAAGGHDTGGEG